MKDNKGFTLIELIIVLTIIGVFLSMVYSPVFFSYKNFDIQNERTKIISDARFTMDYLTRQIRKSNEVSIITKDNIKIGSSTYKLENKTLFKDSNEVIKGIDELNISKVEKKINIEIIIKDISGKDYKLSSTINIR